jgi:hypothetical protein
MGLLAWAMALSAMPKHAQTEGGYLWVRCAFPAAAETNPADPMYGLPGAELGCNCWFDTVQDSCLPCSMFLG